QSSNVALNSLLTHAAVGFSASLCAVPGHAPHNPVCAVLGTLSENSAPYLRRPVRAPGCDTPRLAVVLAGTDHGWLRSWTQAQLACDCLFRPPVQQRVPRSGAFGDALLLWQRRAARRLRRG